MRKDRTPEEIRAGWAKNLSDGPPAERPKPRMHITPEESQAPLRWKLPAALVIGLGLLAWLATHGWKF